MKVEADALAVEIKKDFPSCDIEVFNSDALVVSDSFAAGMYYREYYDSFIESINRFIMMYTKEWKIQKSGFNTIEGNHWVFLERD